MRAARTIAAASSSAPSGPSREADIVIANHALVMVNAARGRRGRAERGSSSTRAIICSTPRTRPSRRCSAGRRRSSCAAGSSGPRARSRGRRRGLAARLMDVASYDEEGARRSKRRSRRRGLCRRTAGCSGWAKARRSGRSRRCSPRCAGRFMPGPKRRRPGYGLETELAEPDGALVGGGGGGLERWRHCATPRGAGPAARSGAGGCARLARCAGARPGRGRDHADSPGGARPWRHGSRCWRGSAARPMPISSTGWRSSGSTGANMMLRSTAAGSTRHSPSRSRAGPGARRAGDVGDAARVRRLGAGGCAHRGAASAARSPSISRRKARSIMRGWPEVLIVTDLKRGDIAALAGAYARLIEAAGGRDARAVHRDPAAEGGACADRRPARARRACRCSPSMSIRSTRAPWSTSSATIRVPPCSVPMRLRDGVDVPGESLRLVVMERVPWPRPTVLHAARRLAGGGSAYDDGFVKRAAGARRSAG